MNIPFNNMQEAAALAKMAVELKDSEDGQAIIQSIATLAESCKPALEKLNEFSTKLDIDAIKQMIGEGLTTEQAITLRGRSPSLFSASCQKIQERLKR